MQPDGQAHDTCILPARNVPPHSLGKVSGRSLGMAEADMTLMFFTIWKHWLLETQDLI